MNYKMIKDRIDLIGMSYNEYLNKFIDELAGTDLNSLDEKGRKKYETKKLNLQRSTRIMKTHEVSLDLEDEIKKINDPQLWIVITENWCGDSAQNLPYLALIALKNPLIDFKLILRDSNLDIMDQYLLNGTRSIPILIAFDLNGNELFRWGARPKIVQDLFLQWKDEGIVKPELYEKLHLWYSRNKGQALEAELAAILRNVEHELRY